MLDLSAIPSPWDMVIKGVIAGVIASFACGLGALPLLIPGIDPKKHTGLGYGFAGGLMFSASVYNLILPGFLPNAAGVRDMTFALVMPVLGGLLLGSMFLSVTDRWLAKQNFASATWQGWGGKTGMLIFLAMAVHSIPEGVAVGAGYTAGEVQGTILAVAIAIHNIPEGLAVSIPMRAAGASFWKCFWAATFTSLPQPVAVIPAVLLAYYVTPLMPILMGFAAGAMIFLVVMELIPDALASEKPRRIAWAFIAGFCTMLLIQVVME